ncbi:hypothetical protein C2E16_01335 [Mixta calida]|uniref:Uncharacterized protein n=1 Tax=Mixta calida TaxID=665913 RepID=A0ABM6RX70_9GAMM|nr:hypothetical protein C2E16_01335 [Mixta calida]ORM58671.1 hypothetical protein HA40_10965 [Mixta calida]
MTAQLIRLLKYLIKFFIVTGISLSVIYGFTFFAVSHDIPMKYVYLFALGIIILTFYIEIKFL